MARIPNTELNRLKSGISLVRLVKSSGIELKQPAYRDMVFIARVGTILIGFHVIVSGLHWLPKASRVIIS